MPSGFNSRSFYPWTHSPLPSSLKLEPVRWTYMSPAPKLLVDGEEAASGPGTCPLHPHLIPETRPRPYSRAQGGTAGSQCWNHPGGSSLELLSSYPRISGVL